MANCVLYPIPLLRFSNTNKKKSVAFVNKKVVFHQHNIQVHIFIIAVTKTNDLYIELLQQALKLFIEDSKRRQQIKLDLDLCYSLTGFDGNHPPKKTRCEHLEEMEEDLWTGSRL